MYSVICFRLLKETIVYFCREIPSVLDRRPRTHWHRLRFGLPQQRRESRRPLWCHANGRRLIEYERKPGVVFSSWPEKIVFSWLLLLTSWRARLRALGYVTRKPTSSLWRKRSVGRSGPWGCFQWNGRFRRFFNLHRFVNERFRLVLECVRHWFGRLRTCRAVVARSESNLWFLVRTGVSLFQLVFTCFFFSMQISSIYRFKITPVPLIVLSVMAHSQEPRHLW